MTARAILEICADECDAIADLLHHEGYMSAGFIVNARAQEYRAAMRPDPDDRAIAEAKRARRRAERLAAHPDWPPARLTLLREWWPTSCEGAENVARLNVEVPTLPRVKNLRYLYHVAQDKAGLPTRKVARLEAALRAEKEAQA